MTLARWQATIQDDAGNIVPGAQITVRREITGAPLALLYSDRAGATPIGNPFNADPDGFAAFHVAGGSYRIDAVAGSITRTWRYVPIGLAGESDAVTAGIQWRFNTATADADPGTGYLALDNATLGSATKIFISETNNQSADLSAWLASFDDGGSSGDRGTVVLQSQSGGSILVATVTGTVADDGGYRDVSITPLASSGTFAADEIVTVQFMRAGVDGDGDVTATGTMEDNYVIQGDGSAAIKATTDSYAGDLDSLASTVAGVRLHRVTTGASNTPSGAGVIGSHVVTHVWDANAARQVYYEHNSNRIFTRAKNAGSWGPWGGVGAGKQSIWVPASAMAPGSSEAAAAANHDEGANGIRFPVLLFDPSSPERANFQIAMPKGWNEGTVTFRAFWSHPATTTNFGVVWGLRGVSLSNDDTLGSALPSSLNVTDTGGTTNDLYITDESSAVTLNGTPAEGDLVSFQITRNTADGSDTLAVDARLHGVMIYYTTNSNTDD